MNQTLKKILITCLIATAIAGIVTLSILMQRGWGATTQETYKNFSDAFSVPGVLLMAISAVVWISQTGGFDAIGFIMGKVVRSLIPFGRSRELKGETYAEYKDRKHPSVSDNGEKSGVVKLCLLAVGALFVITSIVFAVLWS